jgi:hypothetical protein
VEARKSKKYIFNKSCQCQSIEMFLLNFSGRKTSTKPPTDHEGMVTFSYEEMTNNFRRMASEGMVTFSYEEMTYNFSSMASEGMVTFSRL